jgi:hypothetical protein
MLLVGKLEGKEPVERPRRCWVDIRMDSGEIGWGGMDWICLSHDTDKLSDLVRMAVNLQVL